MIELFAVFSVIGLLCALLAAAGAMADKVPDHAVERFQKGVIRVDKVDGGGNRRNESGR